MEMSVFDVLGPVMIGPSSSHTAGAARLGRVAALIARKPFHKVSFGLSGSFAQTGIGHGTERALLAGVLGIREDDERLRDSARLAEQRALFWEFYEEEIIDMHENTVHITFCHEDDSKTEIWGSSIGGGRIRIHRIGHLDVEITGEYPTLIVSHLDRPGVVSDVSRVLVEAGLNIAVMRLSRKEKGKISVVVLEMDESTPDGVIETIRSLPNVREVMYIELS